MTRSDKISRLQRRWHNDWRQKVYQPPVEEAWPEDWADLRDSIFERDYHRCVSCHTRYPKNTKQLSLHHVLPRAEGGSNEPENLVTVCYRCHDLIEPFWASLRTKTDIRRFYEAEGWLPELEVITPPEPSEGPSLAPTPRPTWHGIVYGGQRP